MSVGPQSARSPAPAEPRSSADFCDVDKERFRGLAGSMSFVGASSVLFALLFTTLALGGAASGLGLAAVGLACVAVLYGAPGWWIMSAGRSFSSLARTRGGDVDHVLDALTQMRRLFSFLRALVLVETVLLTAAAGAYVWCNFASDKGGKCIPLWG